MSLKRNTLWNLAGTGLPLLLGVVTIPYLIRATGVEAFGILTLVWALIGYFSLFDLGLGRALTQQVAAARSTGSHAQLPGLVKTGLWFTAGTGVLGGVVLAALAHQLAANWLKVSDPLQPTTVQALIIAAIGIPLTTVTTGLRGILEAFEDFRAVNLLRSVLGAANFGLPALSVMFIGDSLAWMVGSLVAARLLVLLLHGWLVYKKLAHNWYSAPVTKKHTKGLLSFGIWMTITNVVGPLMVTADRFIISAVLGASVVAYYTVPFEALTRLLVLPGALTSALYPRLAFVMTTDAVEARRLYKKSLALTIGVLLPICLLVAAGSKWGLTVWLGSNFAEQSWLIVCIMAVGILLNGIAYIPFATIQATGDARSTALVHVGELVIYIPLLFFALRTHGLVGAAAVWSIRAGVDLIVLLIIANKKFSKKT